MNEAEHERQPEHHETERRDPPRIWVASLSDYNAGYLHGAWIDATQPVEDIWTEINAMLADSHEPGAEEHAIFDHDGFEGIAVGEYEAVETVAALAQGVAEWGRAFASFANYLGSAGWADGLEQFEDVYCGTWRSATEFAENYLEAFGIDLEDLPVPELIRPYLTIDTAALAEGILDGHVYTEDDDGTIHVFDP